MSDLTREEVERIQGIWLEERKPWDESDGIINILCDSWLTLDARVRELEQEIVNMKTGPWFYGGEKGITIKKLP